MTTWPRFDADDVRRALEDRLGKGERLEQFALAYEYQDTWRGLSRSTFGVVVEGLLTAFPTDRTLGPPFAIGRTARRLVIVRGYPVSSGEISGLRADDGFESLPLSELTAERARATRDGDNVTLHLAPDEGHRSFFFNRHSLEDNLERAEAIARPWLR